MNEEFAIHHPTPDMLPQLKNVWKQVFGDEDEYINLIFDQKYNPSLSLVVVYRRQVVSMLHLQPYTLKMWGHRIPFYYLMGLATLPQFRGKGLMERLIHHAHRLMHLRGIPLAVLVPAEQSLFAYYQQFGYVQTSHRGSEVSPSLQSILQNADSECDAYQCFDRHFNQVDFSVQKSFEDFRVIVAEARQENFPSKQNLWCATFVQNIDFLLSVYAEANIEASFSLAITRTDNSSDYYRIQQGRVERISRRVVDFSCSALQLTQLLFGFDNSYVPSHLRGYFPVRQVYMNYMLE